MEFKSMRLCKMAQLHSLQLPGRGMWKWLNYDTISCHGIQVNAARQGATPLYMAAEYGHVEVVKLLLAVNTIQVNAARQDGATPLFIAADKGHVEVVKLLQAVNGIQVNAAMQDG